MRNVFLFIMMGFFLVITASASYAFDDGFGERFFNQAPTALGDHTTEKTETQDVAMDDIANDLQSIQPAAGVEDAPSDNETDSE